MSRMFKFGRDYSAWCRVQEIQYRLADAETTTKPCIDLIHDAATNIILSTLRSKSWTTEERRWNACSKIEKSTQELIAAKSNWDGMFKQQWRICVQCSPSSEVWEQLAHMTGVKSQLNDICSSTLWRYKHLLFWGVVQLAHINDISSSTLWRHKQCCLVVRSSH